MQSGKQDRSSTEIATAIPDRITVRGFDLTKDLIGRIGFTEYFLLLVTGVRPTELQKYFVDAALVAVAEHGLVPSVVAARMTLAAAPDAWQGAVSAGLLGCGSVVLGSSETAGILYSEIAEEARTNKESIPAIVRSRLQEMKRAKSPIPGFGHPLHSTEDPRASRLLSLADEHGTAGVHVAILRELAVAVPEVYGRAFAINVSGAIPAVLLDVGFPLKAMKGIPLLARTASLVGHLLEEATNPIGFAMADAANNAISYSGVSSS
jgi:citrate synthase